MTNEEKSVLSNEAPEGLKCPLTRELMSEPSVINGNCYERDMIRKWLRRSGQDPMTREPCQAKDLRPSYNIRAMTEQFVQQYRDQGQVPRPLIEALHAEEEEATVSRVPGRSRERDSDDTGRRVKRPRLG